METTTKRKRLPSQRPSKKNSAELDPSKLAYAALHDTQITLEDGVTYIAVVGLIGDKPAAGIGVTLEEAVGMAFKSANPKVKVMQLPPHVREQFQEAGLRAHMGAVSGDFSKKPRQGSSH